MAAEERAVLEALYKSTDGDHWRDRGGWTSTDSPCEWRGVRCEIDYSPNRATVRGISLPFNGLRGSLPESIASLPNLEILDVTGNELSGSLPEKFLALWDQNAFELGAAGNCFSNLVAKIRLEYSASGTLCAEDEDVRFTLDVTEAGTAVFRSVRCMSGTERETHCLVREGTGPSLTRLSRALRRLGFERFEPSYDHLFTGATHAVFITTTAWWGDGSSRTLETYADYGPIEAWMAQELFMAVLPDCTWDLEYFTPRCDLVR